MKVLYDHQAFSMQRYGGVSRYFYEIANFFHQSDTGIDVVISLRFSNNHYISNSEFPSHKDFFPEYDFRGKYKLIRLANQLPSIQALKSQKFDVFHPTYYDPYFLKYLGNKPFVLTVHDMIHEKFPNDFSSSNISKNKKILCEKADRIIAISKNTKKDLIDIFGIDEKKIDVIYHGNSLTEVKVSNVCDIQLPEKYILFVGSRKGYKNFNKFINAMQYLLHSDDKLRVVCVGGGGFSRNEIRLLEALRIRPKVQQYDLDDEHLSVFYQNAELFVFPSLYEGFGIPILEAFSCKCPLICSNTSSFPEIAGNGARYFDPGDENSIFQAVKQVLYNANEKDCLVSNGMQRLKCFSWGETVNAVERVYKEILKGK